MITVLVVTGSREWPMFHLDFLTRRLCVVPAPDILLVGDCPTKGGTGTVSVDEWAWQTFCFGQCKSCAPDIVPAFWDTYGPSAGPIRNTEIARRAKYYLDGGCRVIAEAFPLRADAKKGGTIDCIKKLRVVGVEVTVTEVPR